MRSDEPIDVRSIRLSVDDYATNEDGTKSDGDDECLKGFDTISPVAEQHDTVAEVCHLLECLKHLSLNLP